MLLQPRQRPEKNRTQDTEEGRKGLENEDKQVTHVRDDEFDKLRGLVEIFLLGDVVVCALAVDGVLLFAGAGSQVEDGGKGDWGDMEGNEPDGEYLRHGHVELEVFFVECFRRDLLVHCLLASYFATKQ